MRGGEGVLDFTFARKAALRGFREDQLTIDNHVELPARAWLDGDVLAETRFEAGSQTGRTRLVASSLAIQDFGSHILNASAPTISDQRESRRASVQGGLGLFAVRQIDENGSGND